MLYPPTTAEASGHYSRPRTPLAPIQHSKSADILTSTSDYEDINVLSSPGSRPRSSLPSLRYSKSSDVFSPADYEDVGFPNEVCSRPLSWLPPVKPSASPASSAYEDVDLPTDACSQARNTPTPVSNSSKPVAAGPYEDVAMPRDAYSRPRSSLAPIRISQSSEVLATGPYEDVAMPDGVYSRPRSSLAPLQFSKSSEVLTSNAYENVDMHDDTYSRPRATPIPFHHSKSFDNGLLSLYQTPRSIASTSPSPRSLTPDARSQDGHMYQMPKYATVGVTDCNVESFLADHPPFQIYRGPQERSNTTVDADSGCGSGSATSTPVSPLQARRRPSSQEADGRSTPVLKSGLQRPRKVSAQTVENRRCMVIEMCDAEDTPYLYNKLAQQKEREYQSLECEDGSESDGTLCPSPSRTPTTYSADDEDRYTPPEEKFPTRDVYALSTKLASKDTRAPEVLQSVDRAYEDTSLPASRVKRSLSKTQSSESFIDGRTSKRSRRRRHYQSVKLKEPTYAQVTTPASDENEERQSPNPWGFGMIASPTGTTTRPDEENDNAAKHEAVKHFLSLTGSITSSGQYESPPDIKRTVPLFTMPPPAFRPSIRRRRHPYEEITAV